MRKILSMQKPGLIFEQLVIENLNKACILDTDPIWDHIDKLDCIVYRGKRDPRLWLLGMQITTRVGCAQKQEKFLKAFYNQTNVKKAIYFEFDHNIRPKLAAEVAYAFSRIFCFGNIKSIENTNVIGLRVYRDGGHKMFDLEKKNLAA